MEIVTWDASFATGIEQIDKQHKELVNLTNELYNACVSKEQDIESVFKAAMHSMVEYVRFHFKDEQLLLEEVKYPGFADHKKEHEKLILNILAASKDYEQGKIHTPNHFVRTLKDWIFGHIAVSDQAYARFIHGKKN